MAGTANGETRRERFRRFRWTRPFWGGLLVLFAGLVIGYIPLGPIAVIVHAGVGGVAGFACALILIAMGLFIWFGQSQRLLAAIVAVVVSLASFPLSNFGGFIVGMMSGIIGGCLTFGWVPDKAVKAKSEQPEPSEDAGGAAPVTERV